MNQPAPAPAEKKPWQSKTLLTNFAIAALALFYPPAKEWISANPEMVAMGWTLINTVLRLLTKDKITIS